MHKLTDEQMESLQEAIMDSEAPVAVQDAIVEELWTRYASRIPEGVNLEIHKQVAQAIGASVVKQDDGWHYVDERGKVNPLACAEKDAAWLMSQEDWTRNVEDANLLFSHVYERGIHASDYTLWAFDRESLSAVGRCNEFLAYVNATPAPVTSG